MARSTIAAAHLAPHDARRELETALHGSDAARLAGGIASGTMKARCTRIARQHSANAVALADALYGAPDAATLALSDDALLAALEA